MDNVTHSLVGIAFGELWHHYRQNKKPGISRRAVVIASFAGNNVPDLDFIYASLTDAHVGYLLHHRGHTHTLVAGLLFLLLPWLYTKLAKPPTQKGLKRSEWFFVFGLGLWLHILLDSLNSYGVHPFWPLDNHWYYLDTLFILEPLAWVALLPALIFSTRHKGLRISFGVCFFGIIAMAWAFPYASWQAAALSTMLALAVWFSHLHQTRVRRFQIGMAVFWAVVVCFFVTGRMVKWRYFEKLAQQSPDRKIADTILAPLPTNPFCWALISVERKNDGKTYFLKRGVLASFPAVHPVALCPEFKSDRGVAPLNEVIEADTRRYAWLGEYRGDLSQLRDLQKNHCYIGAFLDFARAPFLIDLGDKWQMGDMRFDFRSRLAFARPAFSKVPTVCPATTVPWVAPINRW